MDCFILEALDDVVGPGRLCSQVLGYTPVIQEIPTGPGPGCSVVRFQVDPGPDYCPDGAADIFDLRSPVKLEKGDLVFWVTFSI